MKEFDLPQNWDFYPCKIDGHPASVRLNLGLAAAAPVKECQYRLLISIPMLYPSEEGLSSREEFS